MKTPTNDFEYYHGHKSHHRFEYHHGHKSHHRLMTSTTIDQTYELCRPKTITTRLYDNEYIILEAKVKIRKPSYCRLSKF